MPNVARIVGTGMYVPDRVVRNEELSKWMKTSPEWIEERTGIKERRWVRRSEGPSGLAIAACDQALEEAGWAKEDVDLVLFATLSSDFMFPGSGCVFQKKYGLETTPAMDIRNQCSGFLYGMQTAKAFCESGVYKRVLVIGAEVHSAGLDVTTDGRNVSVIFGDGAGVACVEATDDSDSRGAEVGSFALHSDGGGADKLTVVSPTTLSTPIVTHDMFNQKTTMPHMEGPAVFRHAIVRLDEVANEILEKEGLQASDIDLVVPHQANMRINAMVSARLGIDDSKVMHNIQKYGNTTAASIPIALHEARQEGKIQEGSTVMLLGFGAGFTWGAGILRF